MSQAVLAMESFADAFVHHHSDSSTQQLDQDQSSDSNVRHDGDHCCHGVAHFLALTPYTPSYTLLMNAQLHDCLYSNFISLADNPPKRPPIA